MPRFYRELTSAAPDELAVAAGLTHSPDGSGQQLAAMLVCHCGPADEATAALHPLKAFSTPNPRPPRSASASGHEGTLVIDFVLHYYTQRSLALIVTFSAAVGGYGAGRIGKEDEHNLAGDRGRETIRRQKGCCALRGEPRPRPHPNRHAPRRRQAPVGTRPD